MDAQTATEVAQVTEAWCNQKGVPQGHPHTWEAKAADAYEVLVTPLSQLEWRIVDDHVYSRECTLEGCEDTHLTTVELVEGESTEAKEGVVYDGDDGRSYVLPIYDPDTEFKAREWLPPGHPFDWDDRAWKMFEDNQDQLPDHLAQEVDDLSWDLLQKVEVPDAVPFDISTLDKSVEEMSVEEYAEFQDYLNAEHDIMAGKVGGERLVKDTKAHTTPAPKKGKGNGKPKKGDPCLDECRGPGWGPPDDYRGSRNTFGTHMDKCPQHPSYDPNKPVWESTYKATPSCKHLRDVSFELENGFSIKALAYRDAKYKTDEDTDIGVYLYSSWAYGVHVSPGLVMPNINKVDYTKQVMLDWPDFSVPNEDIDMVVLVKWMLEEMQQGKRFETGCMGGHGRTGTMLSLLLVAQGLNPGQAIERVREKHCKKGVENAKQAEYVAAFYKLYHGNEEWKKSKTERKRFNAAVADGHKNYSSSTSKGGTYVGATPIWDNKLGLWTVTQYRKGYLWDKELKLYTSKVKDPEDTVTPGSTIPANEHFDVTTQRYVRDTFSAGFSYDKDLKKYVKPLMVPKGGE